jgi:hypothetical protein
VLILRLKQAETAVADGRLDEAFEIVRSEQIRQHRRGQKLIGRLARALANRGRENLDAERIQSALNDCNKAEKLAGNIDEVAKLRSAICSQMEQKRLRDQHRSLNLAQAKRNIQDGWISAGQQILDEADKSDSQAGMVIQQANLARLQLNEVISKVERALQKDDMDNALDIIRQAGISDSKNEKVLDLIFRIKTTAIEKIRTNLDNGRIDLARSLLKKVLPVAHGTSEISELGFAIEQCQKAAEFLAAGRPREAACLLQKVKVICPSAKWLDSVTEQSKKAAELLDELEAGPLGLEMSNNVMLGNNLNGSDEQFRKKISAENPTAPGIPNISNNKKKIEWVSAHTNNERPGLSSEFVMQVDGIGSFLVLRENRVTIGPISSSARPAVGLMANPNLPVATIERVEDDYFIRSSSPISVNGTAVTDKLLVDGDKIAFSPRCSMRFHIPNPASTTAILLLSGTRLGRADIREVILMDRDILIGPGKGNHIPAESLDETITVYTHNGRLLSKARGKVLVDDIPISDSQGIPIDKQIRIGQISFVLTKIKD